MFKHEKKLFQPVSAEKPNPQYAALLQEQLGDEGQHQKKITPLGMESITELYKIGRGPSSSHTIGPERACKRFRENHLGAESFRVILYGSLAKTGEGHGTKQVIIKTFAPVPCDVVFNDRDITIPHPNTMDLYAYQNGREIGRMRVFSVGGGTIIVENDPQKQIKYPYKLWTFQKVAGECRKRGLRLWQYAEEHEGAEFWEYMSRVWKAMKSAIYRGIEDDGVLPGGLGVKKKAKILFKRQQVGETPMSKENRIICAYAYAVSEQNACGETIVTAPTCGSSGVLPAVMYYQQQKHSLADAQILKALATAGMIGNFIKTNASISGAECGCQAEVGSACAMAAAALGELFELNLDKIEYAAEIALEHHLGLTCDPIGGLVQIPCIERNAVAAMRAINAVELAGFLYDTRKISLDKVIRTMKETGDDMHKAYKETSEAGLAKIDIS